VEGVKKQKEEIEREREKEGGDVIVHDTQVLRFYFYGTKNRWCVKFFAATEYRTQYAQ
jgi:hypothetical protein